jgi:diguanylate cyclase (GGDEF)-like protein
MDPPRLLRAGTPIEVAVLAVIALVSGVGCLFAAAVPLAQDAPQTLLYGLGAFGVALGLALRVAGPRVSTTALHAAVVLHVAHLGVMVAVAVTERGLFLSALGFTWTAVYVAYFFRPPVARAYAVGMIAGLSACLLAARAPTDLMVWAALSTMIWLAVVILSRLNERLRAAAHTDSLTQVLNRPGFAVAAARQRAMAERRGESVALAVIDLDDFKAVNDREGHAAGDRLLVEIAGAWAASLRPGDLLARFGGDEFILMLLGATADQVDAILARLAAAHPAAWTAGTVFCSNAESLDEAINRADARLYAEKQSRRRSANRGPQPSGVWSWQLGRA